MSSNRDTVRNLMQEGNRHLRAKNFEAAIDSYTQTIQHDSAHVSAYIGRARAYIGSKDKEAAKRDLSNVIAHYNWTIGQDKWSRQPYFHRGIAHANMGQYEEAVRDIQKWIDLNRNYYRTWFLVIEKVGPTLVEMLNLQVFTNLVDWYDTWDQIRYEAAPIESLIMDLWDEDQTICNEAILKLGYIGEPALIPLLMQLQKDDRNSEVDIYENNDLRRAIAAIGQPAILALAKHLTTTSDLDRAAAKTLHWFDDPLAEELLRQVLDNPKVSDYIKEYIRSSLRMIEMRKERKRKQDSS